MNPPPVVPDSRRILVVAYDSDLREALIDVLSSEGNDARGASDGAEGVAIAREWAPDLVMLDLLMPTLNGWEVAQQLRADPRTVHIPIVTMTAASPLLAKDASDGGRGADDADGDDAGGAAGAVASLILRSGRAVAGG
jgi:two-component system response regulator RpaA